MLFVLGLECGDDVGELGVLSLFAFELFDDIVVEVGDALEIGEGGIDSAALDLRNRARELPDRKVGLRRSIPNERFAPSGRFRKGGIEIPCSLAHVSQKLGALIKRSGDCGDLFFEAVERLAGFRKGISRVVDGCADAVKQRPDAIDRAVCLLDAFRVLRSPRRLCPPSRSPPFEPCR